MNGWNFDRVNYGTDARMYRDKSFSFWTAALLITSVYLIPFATSFSFGEVILIGIIGWLCIKNAKLYFFKNNALYLFSFYSIVVSLLFAFIYHIPINDTLTRLLRDSFYWCMIYVFGNAFLDYDFFLLWVRRICTALAVFIIIQFFVFFFTGYLIPGFPMQATVAETATASEIYHHTANIAVRNGYLKANGFLTEGAHCAQALTIGIISLFDFDKISNNNKETYILLALYSIASVLTFSAMGLALTFIAWILIIFRMMRDGVAKQQVGVPVIAVLVVFCAITFLGDSLNLNSVIGRISSASSSDTADNSSFLRIYKGFEAWSGFPLEHKMLGIGFGNFSKLSYLSNISGGHEGNEYMNSFSYILVSGGLIGFSFYFKHMLDLYRKTNRRGKSMMVILIAMSLTSSPYSSVSWIWMLMVIIYGCYTIDDKYQDSN